MPKVKVRESSIHGKGLFATENILPGEIILSMSAHLFSLEKFHPWNGEDMGTIPFFINHSCGANAILVFSQDLGRMLLRAQILIEKEQEITLNYWLTEISGELIPCNCPSANCRGSFPVHRKKIS